MLDCSQDISLGSYYMYYVDYLFWITADISIYYECFLLGLRKNNIILLWLYYMLHIFLPFKTPCIAYSSHLNEVRVRFICL